MAAVERNVKFVNFFVSLNWYPFVKVGYDSSLNEMWTNNCKIQGWRWKSQRMVWVSVRWDERQSMCHQLGSIYGYSVTKFWNGWSFHRAAYILSPRWPNGDSSGELFQFTIGRPFGPTSYYMHRHSLLEFANLSTNLSFVRLTCFMVSAQTSAR